MTVAELKEELNRIIDADNTLVCLPDFSVCSCGGRDGEYQAIGIRFSPGTNAGKARLIIE